MIRSFSLLLALGLVGLAGCSSLSTYIAPTVANWQETPLPPEEDEVFRVFLIGDVGGASWAPLEPSLQLLKAQLDTASENSAVVFLGDNVYDSGLTDSTAASRATAERILTAQLHAVEDYKGRVVFIPGNHDWNNSTPGGLDALRRQEDFIEAYLDRGNTFRPDNGFPGPDEIKLTDDIRLVVIDTEWWLTDLDKPSGDTDAYDVEGNGDFLLELNDLIRRRRKKSLLVVAHHPMFSNGRHDGRVPAKQHLFPLTATNENLLIPLPIVGTLTILYRQIFGGSQDLPHPKYTSLRRSLTQLFGQHENLIYASGHDHNLQYFQNREQHYLVSGSGSRPEYVDGGRGAVFTSAASGHMTLHYYEDGSVWMQAWGVPTSEGAPGNVDLPEEGEPQKIVGELLFRVEMVPPSPDAELEAENPEPVVASDPDLPDKATVAINPEYKATQLEKWILGDNNRDAWTMEVEYEVFNIDTVAGGLTPIKRGGGAQTTSLRLEDKNGHEYVLRTLDKDPTSTVPGILRTEAVFDLVRDQTTAINPFGAFIIPPMAEAIGIYHTYPRPVFVPDDPRFGIYQELVANKVMLFEERPDDDMSDRPHFGNSEKVIGAPALIRELDNDNDHRVDQHFYLRNRLFDMLISDWDRHSDQWRWASFEPFELDSTLVGDARTQGKIYRPIPRDRDWAFNRTNGFGPSLSKIFLPKLQDFDPDYGNIAGLAENGFTQDRRMLNQLTREHWLETAEYIRTQLTDAVIDSAVATWPQSVFERYGGEIKRKLKIRRDKLAEVAEEYYEIQAKVVDVIGSHKHERFEVTHHENGKAEVVVYKTSRQGETRYELYRRTFHPDDTEEIRLYGMDGYDQFTLTGEARIHVRVIGGAGQDIFTTDATGKTPTFYDTIGGNTITVSSGAKAKIVRSDDPANNAYHKKEYKLDRTLPVPYFGSNSDDGIFFGGGFSMVKHGFRKEPYARKHIFQANFAPKTRAFNVNYDGQYVDVLGYWDLRLDTEYLSPDNIRNFYGLGNETENTENNREFYQARLTQFNFSPILERTNPLGIRMRLGPTFEYTKVGANEDRFVSRPQEGISESTFNNQIHAGLEGELAFESVDNHINPMQGFIWRNTADANLGIGEGIDSYARVASELRVYFSPYLARQLTIATRIGGAHNLGEFPFFAANTLGGKYNLRGFRSTRFAGRSSFYQNVEIRAHLFYFSNYATVGQMGVLGFLDNGRVWTDGERSKVWHQGYGGGVWMSLFNAAVLTGTFGFSEDDTTFTLSFGFLF